MSCAGPNRIFGWKMCFRKINNCGEFDIAKYKQVIQTGTQVVSMFAIEGENEIKFLCER